MRAAVVNAPVGYLGMLAPRSAKPDGIVWVADPKGGKTKAMSGFPASPWYKTWTTPRFRKAAR
jgi:hypothetical protein